MTEQFEFCGRRVDKLSDDKLVALMAGAEKTIEFSLEIMRSSGVSNADYRKAKYDLKMAKEKLSVCGELLTLRNYKAEFLREVKTNG